MTTKEGSGPDFDYALISKEKQTALRAAAVRSPSATPSSPEPELETDAQPSPQPHATPYSAALIEFLTAHKTAAIAAELSQQPSVALAAVVHAMLLSIFSLDLGFYRSRSSLQLSLTQPHLSPVEDSPASRSLDAQRKQWFAQLPRKSGELWEWVLAQDTNTLLQLLAFLAAQTVNAIESKNDDTAKNRKPHAHALAAALAIDMTRWFTPTAENCFDRLSKARIAVALTEAGKAPDSTKLSLKKPQFAKIAELEIAGTGWLPEPIRLTPIADDEVSWRDRNNDEDEDEPIDPALDENDAEDEDDA